MEPATEETRAEIKRISEELAALRARVEALESGRAGSAPVTRVDDDDEEDDGREKLDTAGVAAGAVSSVAFVGRTLLELGGAYFLRALADGHVVSATLGASLAITYAAGLLWLADRDAHRSARESATFQAVAAMLIAFPAIGEATTRLQAFTPTVAGALLVAMCVAGLFVAWRNTLAGLGWLSTLFAVVTAFALLRGTGDAVAFVVSLMCVAAATEVMAFDDRWLGPRWVSAIGADIAMLFLASMAVRPGGMPEGYLPIPGGFAVGAQLALPMLYVVAIGVRTVVLGRLIRVFAVLQGSTALLLGLWGAARILTFQDASPMWVGVIALLLSVATYGVAFAFAALHEDKARNYYFYTTLAGFLLLAALGWLLDGANLGLAQVALAVVGVGAGLALQRGTLVFHGTVLVVAGTITTGLVSAAFDGLFAAAAGPWGAFTSAAVVALIAGAACLGMIAVRRVDDGRHPARVAPVLALGAVTTVGLTGLLAALLAGVVAAAPGAGADAGFLSALRTGLLTAGAIALAALARRGKLSELRWLVPVVLAVCGFKILLEDFAHGRPASQFLTLAFYGLALLVTPRLLRRTDDPVPATDRPTPPP